MSVVLDNLNRLAIGMRLRKHRADFMAWASKGCSPLSVGHAQRSPVQALGVVRVLAAEKGQLKMP